VIDLEAKVSKVAGFPLQSILQVRGAEFLRWHPVRGYRNERCTLRFFASRL